MKLYNEPGITRVSSEFRHQTPCLGLASSRQRSPTAGRALPAVRWCGGQRAERPRLSLEPQGPDETWWNHGVPRKNPKSGMVFNGKSQTKMDDDWGYPYFLLNRWEKYWWITWQTCDRFLGNIDMPPANVWMYSFTTDPGLCHESFRIVHDLS